MTAWLPAMVLVEPLHGLTFALLHLACMQMLSVVVPPALAATAQAIYGAVAVGTMTAIMTLVSGPLYGAFGPRVLVHGAALRRCIADCVCDAQDLDQCIRVKSDQPAPRVVARQRASWASRPNSSRPASRLLRSSGLGFRLRIWRERPDKAADDKLPVAAEVHHPAPQRDPAASVIPTSGVAQLSVSGSASNDNDPLAIST